MEDSPRTSCFAQCISCGKSTFKDLLDKDLRCEYCREVKSRRTHPRFRKKVVTNNKQKT